MKKKKLFKTILIIMLCLAIIGMATLFAVNGYVKATAKNHIITAQKATEFDDVDFESLDDFDEEYEFEDYVHFSEIDFPCEVNKVRFTIKEVYKGEKWDDTCITAVITRWESEYSSIPN